MPFSALRCSAFFPLLFLFVLPLQAAEPKKVNDGFTVAETDWPWWRGPARNGEAAAGQKPPVSWDDAKNVVWKAPIAGRGHGSVAIMGNNIYLQTADEASGAQMVVCLDRKSGSQLWSKTVHPNGGMRKNNKSTAASSTPACDGER